MSVITIGNRLVGDDNPCFVIAEAGVNHNGDPQRAFELVDIAAAAGADAVKFQTFSTSKVAASTARKATYQQRNDGRQGNQFDMLQALELTPDVFAELSERCAAHGLVFMSTAFDHDSLDLVTSLSPHVLKWPSGEIDNFPLIDHAAGLGIPILLSTGMSTLGEVDSALQRFEAGGCTQIAILHCVSNYPATPEDLNLRAIPALASTFRRPVGYSDHSMGSFAALAAVALGISILEKHYTSDRNLPGPDHKASLEPGELTQLIADLREVERALGDGIKRPRSTEMDSLTVGRRSLRAACDIAQGETLSLKNVIALRPAVGLSPALVDHIFGRKAARAIRSGATLDWADIG